MTQSENLKNTLDELASRVKALEAGGGGVSAFQRVFSGPASAGQNLWGNSGTEVTLDWNPASQDINTTFVTFSNGNRIAFDGAGEARVYGSVITINGTANNRSIYLPRLDHFNAGGTLLDAYYAPGFYIRDDNDAYDSGGTSQQISFNVGAGDYIEIASEVLDEGTGSGAQTVDTTRSLIKVDFR